ncbi:MAG TPA: competence/damage-inducible protein A [Verrucomicrobiae bacterium]|nr:competence/damage-inducible protein A [Verrucomicrobiae bacterium]
MAVELINTGSELLLGRVLNTHQQWLCRQLADLGHVVKRQVAVPDNADSIETAVREALGRADLIFVTGGLGPTSDDLTRDRIAHLLGKTLREDAAVLKHISGFFEARNRAMPQKTRVQALVPDGALVLPNPHGTAPGLAIEVQPNLFRPGRQSSWLILLPGPPRELRPMFTDSVIPLLRRIPAGESIFVCRTLRATGTTESGVEGKIGGLLLQLVEAGLELGYCARPGQVDVRLAAHGPKAADLVAQAEALVCPQLGLDLYSSEEEELERTLVRLLAQRHETLALAESCTGGSIANRITDVPGASAVLLAGIVAYCNEAKTKFLGVDAASISQHGAVSEEVARQMAEGARRQTGADYALSVTGIAGPAGGTAEKPVGTVYIGLSGEFGAKVLRNYNPLDRETFKQITGQQAMDLLRRTIQAGR